MATSRLRLALDDGTIAFSGGALTVYGPTPAHDLGGLPKAETSLVQRLKPDHDQLAALGHRVDVAPPQTTVDSLIFLPRSKSEARATVAEARERSSGIVVVDGQKTEAVESIYRELKKRVTVTPAYSKHHGKIFAVTGRGDLSGWEDPGDIHLPGGFVTRVGVFSADGVDEGSALLAQVLPGTLGARVADFGAGWGYLSRAVLERGGVEALDLIEADHRALECARRNVDDPRAAFHWADVRGLAEGEPYDAVVMNPPFHTGRAVDPGLGIAFIHAAADRLRPGGALWLVANRHLPYHQPLSDRFAELAEVVADRSFVVYRAARPRRRM